MDGGPDEKKKTVQVQQTNVVVKEPPKLTYSDWKRYNEIYEFTPPPEKYVGEN